MVEQHKASSFQGKVRKTEAEKTKRRHIHKPGVD